VPLILVVDDEPMIAMMLESWLAELGYQTLGPAHDAASALALIEKSPPDAAIVDVSLGQETGYPVADCLAGRKIDFAFATGYGADAFPLRFKGARVMTKPFDIATVKSAIEPMIEQEISRDNGAPMRAFVCKCWPLSSSW
jgi:CheY-like chemotaxis protein